MFKVHQVKVQMYLKHGSVIGMMVPLSRNLSPHL